MEEASWRRSNFPSVHDCYLSRVMGQSCTLSKLSTKIPAALLPMSKGLCKDCDCDIQSWILSRPTEVTLNTDLGNFSVPSSLSVAATCCGASRYINCSVHPAFYIRAQYQRFDSSSSLAHERVALGHF